MDKGPPVVDDPRARLDAAVTALVAEEGVAGVSVRKVAARAGVSIGMVQHHHPTKRAMLAAASEAVSRSFAARAEAAVEGLPPREALRELCRQLLPLDAARAAEGRVWLAFVAAAVVDDDLAARHTEGWQEVEDLLAGLVARCRRATVRRWTPRTVRRRAACSRRSTGWRSAASPNPAACPRTPRGPPGRRPGEHLSRLGPVTGWYRSRGERYQPVTAPGAAPKE